MGSTPINHNARRLLGFAIDDSNIGDQRILKYDLASGKFIFSDNVFTESDPGSIHRNGDNSPTADIDWGGFDIENLGNIRLANTGAVSGAVANRLLIEGTGGSSGAVLYVDLSVAPTANQVLAFNSSNSKWRPLTAPTGNGTNDRIVRWDGLYALQDSPIRITDAGAMDGLAQMNWSSDGVGNIGQPSAYRPSRGYFANEVQINGASITSTKIGHWDDAYDWGDHSLEGYALDSEVFKKDGSVAATGAFNLDGNSINNVATLTASGDVKAVGGSSYLIGDDLYLRGDSSFAEIYYAKDGDADWVFWTDTTDTSKRQLIKVYKPGAGTQYLSLGWQDATDDFVVKALSDQLTLGTSSAAPIVFQIDDNTVGYFGTDGYLYIGTGGSDDGAVYLGSDGAYIKSDVASNELRINDPSAIELLLNGGVKARLQSSGLQMRTRIHPNNDASYSIGMDVASGDSDFRFTYGAFSSHISIGRKGSESGTIYLGVDGASIIGSGDSSNKITLNKELALGTHKISGVVDPSAAQDAATKNYVDTQGFLTSESDPIFGASAAAGISAGDITNWDSAYTHSGLTSGNPHSVSASDVGLGNVTNNAQVKKISSSTDSQFIAWDGTTGDLPKDSGYSAASFDAAGTAASAVSTHESTYNHSNYDTAYSHSQIVTGNPHALSMDDLSDATISSLGDGEILLSSSGNWINRTFAEADIATDSDLTSHTGDTSIHFTKASINHSDINDDEASKHRLINDSGTSATELWSASKINSELSGKSDTGHTHSAYEWSLNVSYCEKDKAFREIKVASYAVVGSFRFPGTSVVGTPTKIYIIAGRSGGTDMDFKIYDVTNAQTICEVVDQTNTSKAIIDLGTLSNLPSNEAIFEVQALVTAGGTAQISSCNVEV